MIFGVGLDIIDLVDFKKTIDRSGEPFIERVFTERERQYCRSQPHPLQSFAARFAAKESVMKCLGTGWADGVGFRQIEVVRAPNGSVAVHLHGAAAARAAARGIRRVHLSLSHTGEHATAFAVAEA